MLTVQEFPSAQSVPTTLAARPLSKSYRLALAINQEINDLFGRQGSVSISYLSREVLISDLLVLEQRWLGRIQ